MSTKHAQTLRNALHAQKASGANIATFLVVSMVLMARGWGAQSRVDWEETFGIGLALTKNTAAIWEPNNYGIFTARVMQMIIVQLPLSHLPVIIFVFATFFWLVCLVVIYSSILIVSRNRIFASMVVIGLALLPSPVIGGQGAIQGNWWLQTFTLMVVLAAFPVLEPTEKKGVAVLIFTAVTVASFPVAMCLAVPSIFVLTFRNRSFKNWDASLLCAFVAGSVYQLVLFFRRGSLMSYLGDWTPNEENEKNALFIWSETSANDIRTLPRISFGDVPKSLYISVKSIYSELTPEPLRSLIHGDQTFLFSLLTLSSILVLFVSTAMLIKKSVNQGIIVFVSRLTFFLVPIFAFQFITAGTLNVFQYANLFDMTFVVVVCGMIISCLNQRKFAFHVLTAGLIIVFVVSAFQQFRDSSRYGSGWASGYAAAKSYCLRNHPDEVVVISQNNEMSSHQIFSPIGIRCKDLR
jgi:hypothetical protein